MTRRRIVTLTLAVVLATGGGGIVYTQKQQAAKKASSIETAVVKRTTYSASVTSSGKTKAKKAAELKFQTSGKLTWVGVAQGDRVAAYQAIASLDRREVQKNLEKSLRDYVLERNDFEETWRVTYDGRENPQTAFTDTVKRILEKNQWNLEKTVLDVELKNLSVEFATLVTPIAGIVTRVDTPVAGINITPATAVFEVVDPTSMVFEAKVDEVDIRNITVGSPATVTLDAFADTPLTGTVSSIAYAAETSSGGATVFPVEIMVATESATIRIGLNGDVSIQTKSIADALVIPTDALQGEEDARFVYKKSGNRYQKTQVITGERSETDAVILSGLGEGDEVAVKGFKDLPL